MNITLGVPRIQEIINCAYNISGPSMTIYLEEDKRFDLDHAHKLISMLEFTTLKHVSRMSEIYYDPDPDHTIIEDDKDLIWEEHDAEEKKTFSPWVLRIQIDMTLLGRKGLRLKDIKDKIENFFLERPLEIITSIDSSDPIILRIRMRNKSELSPEELTSQFHSLKKIEQYILEDLPIKGFCKKVSYRRNPVKAYGPNGVEVIGDPKGEYVLETSGTDLARVLSFPYVDKKRTTTNHVMDVYKVLGVEASRESMLREISLVFQFFNISVNYRHTTLLADVITSQGKLMSISRNGINRVYTSTLRKSSFEETVEIILDAAAFAELDSLKGVTENVMMGQLCKLGTGCFDVLMDDSYFFFNTSEAEREKISSLWKYFPDLNPVLEVDGGIEDGMDDTKMNTPYGPNTPGPNTDYLRGKTPAMGEFGAFYQSPQVFTPGGLTPGHGMTPRGAMTPNRDNLPHNMIYSPYVRQNIEQ